MSEPMDLAAAIAARRAEAAAAEQEWRASQEGRLAHERAERWVRFQLWIEATFSPALLAALHPTFVKRGEHQHPVMRFVYEGVSFDASWQGDELLVAATDGRLTGRVGDLLHAHDDDTLIKVLAYLHPRYVAADETLAEQAAAREAALAMHARCQERVRAALASAVPWEWPAGRELTIYYWTWGEDDDGYSLAGDLDSAGFVTLAPHRFDAQPRQLMLRYVSPIAERLTIGRVADLPAALRVARKIAVSGIENDYSQQDDDGDPLLVERADVALLVETGDQWPVAWVRDALLR